MEAEDVKEEKTKKDGFKEELIKNQRSMNLVLLEVAI